MLGYTLETSPGLVFNTQVPGSVAFYRTVNAQWNDHFYTLSQADLAVIIQQFGFYQEPDVGFLYPSPQCGAIPLYRFNNNQVHDHVYTTSNAEGNTLTAAGYQYEGIAGYVLPSN